MPFIDTHTFDPVESPARRALESWATGVETILTRMVYPSYNVNRDDYGNLIYDNEDDYYTDIVVELVELVERGGFSIWQIERTLEDTVDMHSWRQNMIKRYGYKKKHHQCNI